MFSPHATTIGWAIVTKGTPMKQSELDALTDFAHASRDMVDFYIKASKAGIDPAMWDNFLEARERTSMAGHRLYRFGIKLRVGEAI